MKQLESFNSEVTAVRQFPQEVRRIWANGKQRTAIVVGLVVLPFLLALGACSKEKKSVASSGNQNLQNQGTLPVSMPEVSPINNVPQVQPVTPKKTVRKRPSTLIYRDRDHGISFRYPRKYMLKTGDQAQVVVADSQPVDMNFVQPGGTTLASVLLPSNLYPGTDFSSAFFMVSVNQKLSESECGQFVLPTHSDTEPVSPPSSVKIGEREFQQVEAVSKQGDVKYYHVFENGGCYELALGMGTSGDQPADGITPVDHEQVFRNLEKILTTVKIKSSVVPEVATAPATPVEASNQ